MSSVAQGDAGHCVFVTQPAGPAEPARVACAKPQFADFVLAQMELNVVVERVAQGEAHQRAQRLKITTGGQKTMETIPVELAYVQAEC